MTFADMTFFVLSKHFELEGSLAHGLDGSMGFTLDRIDGPTHPS